MKIDDSMNELMRNNFYIYPVVIALFAFINKKKENETKTNRKDDAKLAEIKLQC